VSSLAYLKDLSVNYLKIDGSFVRDSLNNTRSESMIKASHSWLRSCAWRHRGIRRNDQLRARMAIWVWTMAGIRHGKAQPLNDLLAELAIYEAPSIPGRG